MLNDEHTKHRAMVNDGNTEKRVKFFFAGFLQIMKAGMQWRILQIYWFGVFGNETHEAFTDGQTDMTNCLFLQAFGGHQHMTIDIAV